MCQHNDSNCDECLKELWKQKVIKANEEWVIRQEENRKRESTEEYKESERLRLIKEEKEYEEYTEKLRTRILQITDLKTKKEEMKKHYDFFTEEEFKSMKIKKPVRKLRF